MCEFCGTQGKGDFIVEHVVRVTGMHTRMHIPPESGWLVCNKPHSVITGVNGHTDPRQVDPFLPADEWGNATGLPVGALACPTCREGMARASAIAGADA